MTAAAPAPGFDLLAWPAVEAARAAFEAAKAARITAFNRWRLAPHGETANRLRAFREATAEALKAEAALLALDPGAFRE